MKGTWKALGSMMITRGLLPILNSGTSSRQLAILAYHRVHPLASSFPFDDDLISATPEQFEQQLRSITGSGFRTIDFYDLHRMIETDTIRNGKYLIISFDDGFEDNYTYAFPLLQKYGCKATVYLITDNIDSGLPFWFERLVYYFKLKVISPGFLPPAHTRPDPVASLEELMAYIKSVPDRARLEIMKNLDDRFLDRIDRKSHLSRPLTWDQIRSMSAHGIEFGSHSCSHPVMPMLAQESEIEWEIAHSKEVIEEKLQKEVISFSYPIGAVSHPAMRHLKNQGYLYATDYFHAKNVVTRMNPFALHRLHVEVSVSCEEFFAYLH